MVILPLAVRLRDSWTDASSESASSIPEMVNVAWSSPCAMASTPPASPDTSTPLPDAVTVTSSSRSAEGVTSTVTVLVAPSSTPYELALNDTVNWATAVEACSGVSSAQSLLPDRFTERTWASYVVFDFRLVIDALMRTGMSALALVAISSSSVQSGAGVDTSLYLTS